MGKAERKPHRIKIIALKALFSKVGKEVGGGGTHSRKTAGRKSVHEELMGDDLIPEGRQTQRPRQGLQESLGVNFV